MKADTKRMAQVADEIARHLSMMLVDKGFVRDPRLSDITITEVQVSRDISQAKVYYILPDQADVKGVTNALNKAAGFFRKHLSDQLALRIVPRLRFVYDESIDRATSIQKMIDAVAPEDEVDSLDDENEQQD